MSSSSTVDRFVGVIDLDRLPNIAISIGPKTTETMIRLDKAPAVEALWHVVSTMDR